MLAGCQSIRSRLPFSGNSITVENCGDYDHPWPQYQHDPANSGASNAIAGSPTFGTITRLAPAERRFGGFAVDGNDTAYVGDGTEFIAYDTATDSVQWRLPLPSKSVVTPTVHCNLVFGAGSATVHAINPQTQEVPWKNTLGIIQGAPLAYGDAVAICTLARVYGLDIESGEKRWEFVGEDQVKNGLCRHDGDIFVTGGEDGSHGLVQRIDERTAERVWKREIETIVKSSPTYDDGAIYCTDNGGTAYRIDAESGQVEWKRAGIAGRLPPTPTVFDDVLVVPGGDGDEIHALDRHSGEPAWQKETGPVISPCIVVNGRTLLVGSANNGLFVINPGGSTRAIVEAARVGSPMAICQNGLYYKTVGLKIDLAKLSVSAYMRSAPSGDERGIPAHESTD